MAHQLKKDRAIFAKAQAIADIEVVEGGYAKGGENSEHYTVAMRECIAYHVKRLTKEQEDRDNNVTRGPVRRDDK